jgi:hypothetical protein
MPFPRGGGALLATTVTGPDIFGAAAVVGSGTNCARNDHDHGLPAAPSSALTYDAATLLTGSVGLGHAGAITPIMYTHSLATGTWLIMPVMVVGFGSPCTATAFAQVFLSTGGTATYTRQTPGIGPVCRLGVIATGAFVTATWAEIVTITVAGTIAISGVYTDTTNDGSIYGNNDSGYAAIKIG